MKKVAQRFCNKCFTPLAPDARFCPECGTLAPQRVVGVCPNCGENVMEGQTACYVCGALVGGSPTVAPAAAPKEKKPVPTGLWMGLLAVLLLAIMAVAVVLLFQPRNAESVELGRSRVSLLPGERVQLKYEVLPENTPDKSVTWQSSDDSVATVKNGEVVAVEAGTCTVTVTTVNGLRDSCTIAVQDVAVQELELSETELTLHVGDSTSISCRILPENAETELVWGCDNTDAILLQDGQITAQALGSCTVTVTAGNGVEAQCKVTVTLREEELLPVGTWKLTRVENRFDETSHAASGAVLTLTDCLTGSLTQDGDTVELTWCFTDTDGDGELWYDLIGLEEPVQFVYSPEDGTLTFYLADENWVFTK